MNHPDSGDIYRAQGPNFINGVATSFLGVNRSKKSLTLDLKAQEGYKIAIELVKQSDVVIENFKPGTAQRLGLGYEQLKAINPRIIYASISGYGQTGPDAERGGYDLMAQGRAGIMFVTGTSDSPPCKIGVPVVDMGAAMYAAFGIASALYCREITGIGQMVDVSLLDTAVSWFTIMAMEYQATGQLPKKWDQPARFLHHTRHLKPWMDTSMLSELVERITGRDFAKHWAMTNGFRIQDLIQIQKG